MGVLCDQLRRVDSKFIACFFVVFGAIHSLSLCFPFLTPHSRNYFTHTQLYSQFLTHSSDCLVAPFCLSCITSHTYSLIHSFRFLHFSKSNTTCLRTAKVASSIFDLEPESRDTAFTPEQMTSSTCSGQHAQMFRKAASAC